MPKIAQIGCGGWGRNLARNLHELGALAAIADPAAEAAARAAEYGVAHHADWRPVLADAAVDAVSIATPAETHAEVALAAIRAGKDVFLEKPIALDIDEARTLAGAAADVGRILMVGHVLNYHPAFERLSALCRERAFGTLRHLRSNRQSFGKVRSEEDVVWSFAPHDISMLLALAGAMPESVSASAASCLRSGIADLATLHLDFGDGLTAAINVSWIDPEKQHRLTVIGEDGMAIFDDTAGWDRKVVRFDHRLMNGDGTPHPRRGDGEAISLEPAEPLKAEMRHFMRCIETRETPRTDSAEAIRVLQVLEAARRSMAGNGAAVAP
ncbi:MAG: Gfo/Idh/MocA family protein [Flavobacteriaceae bacterium]